VTSSRALPLIFWAPNRSGLAGFRDNKGDKIKKPQDRPWVILAGSKLSVNPTACDRKDLRQIKSHCIISKA